MEGAGVAGPAVRPGGVPPGLRPDGEPGRRGGRDAGGLVRLLKARPDFADEEHAKAWLLRVAANCANDLFRAPWRRREEPLPESLSAPESPEPGGVVEAVLALPPKYRTAVHLYYYEDLSVAEIAGILGKSEGAVKSRLFRARALLREWMKEDEDVSHGV